MENRYKLSINTQVDLFKQLETISELKVEELASIFKISTRTYRDWRRGKFTIPEKIITVISNRFNISLPSKSMEYISQWKQSQRQAAKIGGIARTKKYGSPGTGEGRIKGGRQALIVSRKKGLIPSAKPFHPPNSYSKNLAEFIGILLGDGHLDKYQWSISLNATKDKIYAKHVIRLIKILFKFKPSLKIRKNYNVIIIIGNGIKSIQYLTKMGFQIGNKVKHQVDAPLWIKNNNKYCIACLRGLIDTDGGIFNNSYIVRDKKYSYTKLAFANSSMPLLNFVFKTLKNIGFKPTFVNNPSSKRVWLGNQKEVKKYLKIVGTNNPRLLQNIIK